MSDNIDIHAHLLSYKDSYAPFYFGRLPVDPDIIKAIAKAKKHSLSTSIIEIVDWFCKITGKNDIKSFLNFFFLSRGEQWEYYAKNNCITLEVFPQEFSEAGLYKADFQNPVNDKELKTGMIKCYPSENYLPELNTEYTHIITHCSEGGIRDAKSFSSDNNPCYWQPRFEQHENEKYCFAHFGGEKQFCDYFIDNKDNWTKDIVDYARIYNKPDKARIFADTAYFIPNTPRKRKALKNCMESDFRDYLLFGSDMLLILLEPDIDSLNEYKSMYTDVLTPEEFNQISVTNINKFLEGSRFKQ